MKSSRSRLGGGGDGSPGESHSHSHPTKPSPLQHHSSSEQKTKNTSQPLVIGPTVPTFGKDSGAHKSLDEAFPVDALTGTFAFPIRTTPGRAGLGPSLSLHYDSASSNGPFGLRWNLALPSISRKTSKFIPTGPGGAEREDAVQRFRPRTDDLSQGIQHWARKDDAQDVRWRVFSQDNSCTIYGWDDCSRIVHQPSEGRRRIFCWLPTWSYDTNGDAMEYNYEAEDAVGLENPPPELAVVESCRAWEIVPETKDWTFEVILDYGRHDTQAPTTVETQPWPIRQDPFSVFTSAFEIRSYCMCRRILMFHHFPDELGRSDYLVSSTEVEYHQSPAGSFVKSLTASAHTASSQTYREPPCEYKYSTMPTISSLAPKAMTGTLMEFNSTAGTTMGEWVDLDGDGAPGLLHEREDGSWAYQRNLNAAQRCNITFAPPVIFPAQPPPVPRSARSFVDLDKNGSLDVMFLDTLGRINGFVERHGQTWHQFTPFRSILNFAIGGDQIQRIDLTGNGLQDLLTINKGTNEVVWYECLAKAGFDREKRVNAAALKEMPRLPNMGYGKFGSQVRMGNMPLFDRTHQFTTPRLQLADIDGTGTTDMVYFPAAGGVDIYFNHLGNSWSGVSHVESFPKLDTVGSVVDMDLLGSGTSCLCWFGPDYSRLQATQLLYLDLTNGIKMVGTARLGKVGERVGDSSDGFVADVSSQELDDFFMNPSLDKARSLLESYLDGSGGLFQSVQLINADQKGSLKWRFSQREVEDHRGNIIQGYQPFFSDSHRFSQNLYENIPFTLFFVDAHNRPVGELKPNHIWNKSRCQPWKTTIFDAGDTILCGDPIRDVDIGRFFRGTPSSMYSPTWYERQIAFGTKAAWAAERLLPRVVHLDPLGRVILAMESDGVDKPLYTATEYDVLKNQAILVDALGRVIETNTYDLLGRNVYKAGMDFGERWSLLDLESGLEHRMTLSAVY
ncbi:hypothetical protein ACJ41O_003915 [Fusarium nematophilum]